MKAHISRPVGAVLIAITLALAAGCGADTDQEAATPEATPAIAATADAPATDTASIQALRAVEAGFASRNAKARWEGTAMHVKMEGDAGAANAGWTECRVIANFLEEGETAVIELPNGKLPCIEVMARR